eukprot:TRINITY_DN7287_c0_g2_i1.p1 TRINITY_DN7287_c0_g2~~TRINITY_DN7287_c0_g2_i1.p1  ORF type:complete len:198 (+),score=34.26 TRINITY_DN7287_c0_g2_i1:252-845(+)
MGRPFERTEEALQALDEAIRLDASCSRFFEFRSAAQPNVDRALADAERAISLNPHSSSYLERRAQLELEARRPEAAAASLTVALGLRPDKLSLWLHRSLVRLSLGQLSEALADQDSGLRCEARSSTELSLLHMFRGVVCLRLGRPTADFDEATKLDPYSSQILEASVFLRSGEDRRRTEIRLAQLRACEQDQEQKSA